MGQGSGLAGYLRDWREARIVVDISESATTNLGVSRDQIEKEVIDLLAREPMGVTVKAQAHGYFYFRLMADVVPNLQYYGVLDVRVVRPVVVVPIGKVAVAAIWEEALPLSGPVGDFATDLLAAIQNALTKLKQDWQQDNAVGR